MEEKLTKELFDFLKSNGIFLVYCSNKELGTDGPFVQIDSITGLKAALNIKESEESEEDFFEAGIDEIMITGE